MYQQRSHEVFALLKQAIDLEPSASILWTRLGSLYRRYNHLQQAETAYLYSLSLKSNNRMAHSLLARVYKQKGEMELSKRHREYAEYYRSKNPYFKFNNAEKLYAQEQYEEAIVQLYDAIKMDNYVHHFYRLLGLSYLKLNDYENAKKSFAVAKELAAIPATVLMYQTKLEVLTNH